MQDEFISKFPEIEAEIHVTYDVEDYQEGSRNEAPTMGHTEIVSIECYIKGKEVETLDLINVLRDPNLHPDMNTVKLYEILYKELTELI